MANTVVMLPIILEVLSPSQGALLVDNDILYALAFRFEVRPVYVGDVFDREMGQLGIEIEIILPPEQLFGGVAG